MNRKIIIALLLIIFGTGILYLSIGLTVPPSETPWDNTGCWTSNSPFIPKFELVYDEDMKKDVMRLYGDYIKYNFFLTNKKGGALATDKKYIRFLNLGIKAVDSGRFQIFVNLKTTRGIVSLWYEPDDGDYGRYTFGSCRYGLGGDIRNSKWHNVWRDIRKDFKSIFPKEEIFEITSIRFNGDLCVSDIKIYTELPTGEKITEPKKLKLSYKSVWDEDTKKKIWERVDFFDEYGYLMYYSINYNFYWKNGKNKKTETYSYDGAKKTLKSVSVSEYSMDNNNVKTWGYDKDMILTYSGVTQYLPDYLNSLGVYFDKDEGIYYILEREEDYFRGWKEGTRWFNYYKPSLQINNNGETIKEKIGKINFKKPEYDYDVFKEDLFMEFGINTLAKIYEEFKFEEGRCTNSVHSAYDADGHLIYKDVRYHDPGLLGTWDYWGIYFEKETVSPVKIMRGRNFHGERLGGGLFSRLECDYNTNNKLQGMRMIYYHVFENKYLDKMWELHYNNKAELTGCKETVFDPWNSASKIITEIPVLGEEKIMDKSSDMPKTEVMDGNMNFIEGLKPIWKTEGDVIAKKTAGGMRVEKPEDKEGVGYAVQYIPLNKGSHELRVKYERETGEAHIGLDWVSLDNLLTPARLDDILMPIEEYMDDSSVGPQMKSFIFSTDSVGLLRLRIGAASVVIYNEIELRPYALKPKEAAITAGEDEEEEAIPEDFQEIIIENTESLGDEYKLTAVNVRRGQEGDIEVVYQEAYKEIPVYGGTIIVKKKKDNSAEIVGDNTVKIESPPGTWRITPRTTLGREIYKVIKAETNIPEEDIGRIIDQYSAETVIASTREDGNPEHLTLGLHIKGPSVDKVVNTETSRELYKVKNPAATPSAKPAPPVKSIRGQIGKIYSIIREWFSDVYKLIKKNHSRKNYTP